MRCTFHHHILQQSDLSLFLLSAPTHSPQNLNGEVLGPYSLRLSWTPPPDDQHHGIIREYQIACAEHETGSMFRHSINTTEITIDSLHPFYLYNCSVGAVTVHEGPHSAIIALRTEESGELKLASSYSYSSTECLTFLLSSRSTDGCP